jgi:ferredoxin--NADP+ reductase
MPDWLESRVVGRKQWNDSLFSLEIEADLAEFRAGQFVRVAMDIDGERVGRPYSLVNPPDERRLEIHFNEVPEGPLSPRLSQLETGERIWVSSKASGAFTLDKVPECEDLWLLATGTALGVYLSILRTEAPWSRFEKISLVHGARHVRDLAYTETLEALRARHGKQFAYTRATSRDSGQGLYTGRITDLIKRGVVESEMGTGISPNRSHVMLCGNSAMISEMSALLEVRGMQRNTARQPGHFTTEQYH